jgi:hypothetical protein
VEGACKLQKESDNGHPGQGGVFVLEVKFRPQYACRTGCLACRAEAGGLSGSPRIDQMATHSPVLPATRGNAGKAQHDWPLTYRLDHRIEPERQESASRLSIAHRHHDSPKTNPPPCGQQPRQSSLVPENYYPNSFASTTLRTLTGSLIFAHTPDPTTSSPAPVQLSQRDTHFNNVIIAEPSTSTTPALFRPTTARDKKRGLKPAPQYTGHTLSWR